jgi:hypothetical protein
MVPSVHAQAPETIQVSTGGPVAQGDAARLAVVCRCEADMVRVISGRKPL